MEEESQLHQTSKENQEIEEINYIEFHENFVRSLKEVDEIFEYIIKKELRCVYIITLCIKLIQSKLEFYDNPERLVDSIANKLKREIYGREKTAAKC